MPSQIDEATSKALDNLASEISKLKIDPEVNFSPAEQKVWGKLVALQQDIFKLINDLNVTQDKLASFQELIKPSFKLHAEAGEVQLDFEKFSPKYEAMLQDFKKFETTKKIISDKIPDNSNISALRKELKEDIKTTTNSFIIQKYKVLDDAMKTKIVPWQKQMFETKKGISDLYNKLVSSHNSFNTLRQRYAEQAKVIKESRARGGQQAAAGFFNNNQAAGAQEQKEAPDGRPVLPNRGGNN